MNHFSSKEKQASRPGKTVEEVTDRSAQHLGDPVVDTRSDFFNEQSQIFRDAV